MKSIDVIFSLALRNFLNKTNGGSPSITPFYCAVYMFWRAKLCHFALLFLLLAMSDPLFAKVVAVGGGGSGGESLGPADPSSSSSENSEHAPSSSPVAAASFAVAAPQMAAVHLRNVIKYVKKVRSKCTGVIPAPAPLGTLRESCCYYLWRWAKNRLGVFQKVLK